MDIKEVELKQQFYLSDEQYNTLKTNGSIVIDGETIEYDENADYITPDNTDAKLVALKNDLLAIINAKTELSLQIVDTLPEATADDTNTLTIYLLRNTNAEGQNIFDEYIVVNGVWEKIGDTTMHANCATKEELENYYEPLSYIESVTSGTIRVPAEDVDKYHVGMRVNLATQGALFTGYGFMSYPQVDFIIQDIVRGTSFTDLIFYDSLASFGLQQGDTIHRALPQHLAQWVLLTEYRLMELESK